MKWINFWFNSGLILSNWIFWFWWVGCFRLLEAGWTSFKPHSSHLVISNATNNKHELILDMHILYMIYIKWHVSQPGPISSQLAPSSQCNNDIPPWRWNRPRFHCRSFIFNGSIARVIHKRIIFWKLQRFGEEVPSGLWSMFYIEMKIEVTIVSCHILKLMQKWDLAGF